MRFPKVRQFSQQSGAVVKAWRRGCFDILALGGELPVSKISERCLQVRRFGLMNCYLVRESDGLTLIDTAMGAAAIILEASRHMGQPIRRILLTHAHADHVGSLDALKQRIPDAQVFIGTRESRLLAEAARGVKRDKMLLLPEEPQTPVKGAFRKVKTSPDTLVNEGDMVGSLRAINTPGHTPGHLAFLDERDGSLYAGDALVTFSEVRLPFDPHWTFPLPKGGTWHFGTSFASGERLGAVRFERILAGHGRAVEDTGAALRRALDHARRALDSR
jgi:glyoxylase-like metal-dependent hydrolase (beta-lactamase superfamily II)